MSRAVLILALLLAGCAEYREEIGSGRQPVPGSGPDASTSPTPANCENFTPPTGDCTSGNATCSFDFDCDAGEACNAATRRCYASSADCRGTLCNFDDDCASGERCNQTTQSCFRLAESQTCMPCFLMDTDCGAGRCNTELDRCE